MSSDRGCEADRGDFGEWTPLSDLNPELGRTIELVQSAQSGNAEALEELFTRYLPTVRQIAALRMGYRMRQMLDVEDIVQEALLSVLRGIDRFEHNSEGSFRNWLSNCVECAVIDHSRRASAKKRGEGKVRRFGDYNASQRLSSAFAGGGPTPSQIAQGTELEELLEDALLKLPEHYRQVLVQRQLCEMSYKEIAESMGFTETATARKACSRAAKKLKDLLEPDG